MIFLWGNMTHSENPHGFIYLLLQLIILVTLVTNYQVNCDDAYDTSHRVLPVDAEHQHKISKPLDAVCTQTIRDNLVKFLKRHPNPPRPNRKPRQDDDGDEDEDAIAGIIGNIQEGNGALSTLQMIPSVLPQLVSTFTQLSGVVNQGLNGTDTPNLPSFLAKQGMEAIRFFQALAAGAGGGGASPSRVPSESHHVQRIPGLDPIPMRKPRPGQISDPYPGSVPGGTGPLQGNRIPSQQKVPSYPGSDIDDYIDEDIKQYLQPTLAPLRPVEGGAGSGGYQWGNNQNLGNYNNQQQQSGYPDPNAGNGGAPGEMKSSLWQIYKTFRQKPGEVGGLSDFQLAHPEAFSNELLQSISQAISSIRGQMGAMAAQMQGQGSTSDGTLSIPTEKAPTEILKEIFAPAERTTEIPTPPPQTVAPPSPPNGLASIFGGLKRPTLSVYKPTGSISGVAVDLTNLALNASQNVITERPPQKIEEEVPSSGEDDKTTQEPQGEVAAPPGAGLGRPLKQDGTLIGTGTLDSLKAQQNTAKLVNALGPTRPTTTPSPLFHLPGDTQSNLHQNYQQVGPQLNAGDRNNGFNNKAPYTPVLNGILLEAPRLTPPPPSVYQKRPSDLQINSEPPSQAAGGQGSSPEQKPEFAFQVANKERLPSNFHGPDPTTRRSPTLVAAIPSKFEYEQQQHQVQAGDGVAPQNLFAKPTDAVPESDVQNSYAPPPQQSSQQIQAPSVPQQQNQYTQQAPPPSTQEQQAPPPPPSPSPTPQFTPQQLQAQQLLKQLIILQRVLQRQQQMKLQLQLAQNAANNVVDNGTLPPTQPPPTTSPAPPLPPIPPQQQQFQGQAPPPIANPAAQPILTKQSSSAIANGFASALINNNFPVGSSLIVPNKLNTVSAQSIGSPPLPQQQNPQLPIQQSQQFPQQNQNQPFGQQQPNGPFPQQQANQFFNQQNQVPQQQNSPLAPYQQNSPLLPQQQQNSPYPQQEQNVPFPHQQQNIFSPQQNQPLPPQQNSFPPQQQSLPIQQQGLLTPSQNEPLPQQQNSPLPPQNPQPSPPEQQTTPSPPQQPQQQSSPSPQTQQNLPPFSSLIASSPQFGGNLLQAPSFAKPTTTSPPTTPTTQKPSLNILNGSATPLDAIPFQQFPQFSNNGPSSYFPQASSSNSNAAPDSDIPVADSTTTTAPAAPSTPAIQSSSPNQSPVAAQNSQPLSESTPTPISGAFVPFEPLANFPIQIAGSGPYQPPAASAPTPPSTTTPIPSEPPTTPPSLPLTSVTSTLPPLPTFSFVHSGSIFPAGLPASSGVPSGASSASPSSHSPVIPALPPPPPPRPQTQPPKSSQDPYQLLIRPQFQKPAQNGGYPQFVPSTPILVTSSGLVSPSASSSQTSSPATPPSPVNTVISQLISQETTPGIPLISATSTSTTTLETSSPLPQNSSSPAPASSASLFSQKLKQTSAISEMAKLPYYQEDSFLPSAQKHISTSPSPTTSPPNYDDYDEQPPAPVQQTTPKPFDELFFSNISLETTPIPQITSAPPGSNSSPSNSTNSLPSYAAAEENDSAEEQPYPNFPPGKPVYWMNMFYPNGVPVLTKVTEPTLSQSTSPKPRKRRTKATTTQQTTLSPLSTEPEVEYYDVEEEDENGEMVKKAKKRLKINPIPKTNNRTTTIAPSSLKKTTN